MSEYFYKQSDYTSFAPRQKAIERPIFTEYQKYVDAPDPSFGETFSYKSKLRLQTLIKTLILNGKIKKRQILTINL